VLSAYWKLVERGRVAGFGEDWHAQVAAARTKTISPLTCVPDRTRATAALAANATYDAGVGHGDLNAEFREAGEQNQLIYSVRRSERLVF
jgi:hypothetical protein